jgi:ABC-type dipeptide/oligopeptide/nickel transport system permease component
MAAPTVARVPELPPAQARGRRALRLPHLLSRGTAVFIAKRLVLLVFTVFLVSSVIFFAVHSLPGNALVNAHLHGAALQHQLAQFGLTQPLLVQWWNFISNAVHGNLGVSYVIENEPVTPLVLRELSVSCELGGAALVITIGLGLSVGVIAATHHNTWLDYVLTSLAVIGYTVPSFMIATLFYLFFGVTLANLTNGAFAYPLQWTGTYGTLAELSVPAFAIGLYTSGQLARITRAAMLDVLQQDYIRTAKAKGLRERAVILRHAFRNALVPVVSILGPTIINIIVGVVIIENIFGVPGLGKEFVTSITSHDYNVTVGVFTMFAAMIAAANLVVDLVYTLVDPRIRY